MSTWTMSTAPNPSEQTHCDLNPTKIKHRNFRLTNRIEPCRRGEVFLCIFESRPRKSYKQLSLLSFFDETLYTTVQAVLHETIFAATCIGVARATSHFATCLATKNCEVSCNRSWTSVDFSQRCGTNCNMLFATCLTICKKI